MTKLRKFGTSVATGERQQEQWVTGSGGYGDVEREGKREKEGRKWRRVIFSPNQVCGSLHQLHSHAPRLEVKGTVHQLGVHLPLQ